MDSFFDRRDAGQVLAAELADYTDRKEVIVLALPRGGVPVAYEIAKALSKPLDVFIVRKLGVPGHEELAMGAIAMGGAIVFNKEIVQNLNISQVAIDKVIQAERAELKRREQLYRENRPLPELHNRTIILVDDGIATGATMRAAILALRQYKPRAIIMAVPVAGKDKYEEMISIADKIICPLKPLHFSAVGEWYQNFSQTADNEVHELLEKAAQWKPQ